MTQSRRSKNSVSRGRRRDGIRKVRTRRAVKKARTGSAGWGDRPKTQLSRWSEKVTKRTDRWFRAQDQLRLHEERTCWHRSRCSRRRYAAAADRCFLCRDPYQDCARRKRPPRTYLPELSTNLILASLDSLEVDDFMH